MSREAFQDQGLENIQDKIPLERHRVIYPAPISIESHVGKRLFSYLLDTAGVIFLTAVSPGKKQGRSKEPPHSSIKNESLLLLQDISRRYGFLLDAALFGKKGKARTRNEVIAWMGKHNLLTRKVVGEIFARGGMPLSPLTINRIERSQGVRRSKKKRGHFPEKIQAVARSAKKEKATKNKGLKKERPVPAKGKSVTADEVQRIQDAANIYGLSLVNVLTDDSGVARSRDQVIVKLRELGLKEREIGEIFWSKDGKPLSRQRIHQIETRLGKTIGRVKMQHPEITLRMKKQIDIVFDDLGQEGIDKLIREIAKNKTYWFGRRRFSAKKLLEKLGIAQKNSDINASILKYINEKYNFPKLLVEFMFLAKYGREVDFKTWFAQMHFSQSIPIYKIAGILEVSVMALDRYLIQNEILRKIPFWNRGPQELPEWKRRINSMEETELNLFMENLTTTRRYWHNNGKLKVHLILRDLGIGIKSYQGRGKRWRYFREKHGIPKSKVEIMFQGKYCNLNVDFKSWYRRKSIIEEKSIIAIAKLLDVSYAGFRNYLRSNNIDY